MHQGTISFVFSLLKICLYMVTKGWVGLRCSFWDASLHCDNLQVCCSVTPFLLLHAKNLETSCMCFSSRIVDTAFNTPSVQRFIVLIENLILVHNVSGYFCPLFTATSNTVS